MAREDGRWTRDQKLTLLSIAIMVLIEVLNHLNVLSELFGPAYQLVQPFVPFPIGIAVGWLFCRSVYQKKLRGCMAELEARDALIERIGEDHAAEVAEMKSAHAAELAATDAEVSRLRAEAENLSSENGPEPDAPEDPGPSLRKLMAIGPHRAAGVLDALRRRDAGETYVKFGDHVEDSLDLIEDSGGILNRLVTFFGGYYSSRNEYYIDPEWAAFLAITENRKALEALAAGQTWP